MAVFTTDYLPNKSTKLKCATLRLLIEYSYLVFLPRGHDMFIQDNNITKLDHFYLIYFLLYEYKSKLLNPFYN